MLVVVMGTVATSCNALWGVGDLEYRGVGGAAVDGGTGGAGGVDPDGSTGAAGTGGTGGGAGGPVCDVSTCESCVATGCAVECDQEQDLCMSEAGCQSFGACIHQCDPSDAACQSACALASPGVVHRYYRWLNCSGCASEGSCAHGCEEICEGRCSTGGGCLDCANDTCAQEVCEPEILACAASSECLSFNDCVAVCTDTACNQQCVDTHSDEAIGLYNHWSRCVICTKAACWDDCSGTPFNCAGY